MKMGLVMISVFGLTVGTVLLAEDVPGFTPPHKFPLNKTTSEWRKLLSHKSFEVLRMKDTEPPFDSEYWNNHEAGTYYCAGCGQPLFSSETKFDSHTGWPSFYQPIKPDAIVKQSDHSLGMSRIEVLCSRCGGHLGHVFDDGPKPTGLRFCMNSAAMTFKKGEAPSAKVETKAKAKN